MRKIWILMPLLLVALLVAPIVVGQAPRIDTDRGQPDDVGLLYTATKYPAYGVWVDEYLPSATHCTGSDLMVGNRYVIDTGYRAERALVGFHLTGIPNDAIIESAILYFSCTDDFFDRGTGRTVYVRSIGTSWTCPSWNSFVGSAGMTSLTVGGPGTYNVNVTAWAAARIGLTHGTWPNGGLQFRSTEINDASNEYERELNSVRLVINYRLPTATPTATRTPTATKTNTPRLTYTPSNTPTSTPSRTATPTATLRPGIQIDKRQIDPIGLPFMVGADIAYQIVIHNSGASALTTIMLQDDYAPDYMSFVSADPAPDSVDTVLGLITWNDITGPGALAPGETLYVEVNMRATAPTLVELAWNCAAVRNIVDEFGQNVTWRQDCLQVAVAPRPEIALVKMPRDPVVCVGDIAQFLVALGNVGESDLTSLDMGDTFDPTFLASLNAPFWPEVAPGVLGHLPMVFLLGGGGPGWTMAQLLEFEALAPTAYTEDSVWASANGLPATRQQATASISILPDPGPCERNAVQNPGFETGMAHWTDLATGVIGITADAHGGALAAKLGLLPSEPDILRADAIGQYVTVPADAASASLSFWYNVSTEDWNPHANFFAAAVMLPTGELAAAVLGPTVHTGGWRRATFDMTPFIGMNVGIVFGAYNDGDGVGTLRAYVDDVELCSRTCGPPLDLNPGDPEPGFCWEGGVGYVDYAPHGVPDFDMAPYTEEPEELLADGAVAAANAIWWLDSRAEGGNTPPPTVSDDHALVTAYGAWDDHDERNVAPLVLDLAQRSETDALTAPFRGCTEDGLYDALTDLLQERALTSEYSVSRQDAPSFDQIRDHLAKNHGLALLLGFWEYQPTGWRRLGGHWVTAAGLDCLGDLELGISDPVLDGAEIGRPGEIRPPAGHLAPHAATLHDDAAYLSHDIYRVWVDSDASVGGVCGLQDYVAVDPVTGALLPDITFFAGANPPAAREDHTVYDYAGGPIRTSIERSVAVIPLEGAGASLELNPARADLQVGDILNLDVVVTSPVHPLPAVQAYIDFDPDTLACADPSNQFSVAAHYTAIQNQVDDTTGHADLALAPVPPGYPVEAQRVVATLSLRVLQATGPTGSLIEFNFGEPRFSNVFAGSDPILSGVGHCTVTVSEPAAMRGILELQGRPESPDPSHAISLTVELLDPTSHASVGVWGVDTDQGGSFGLSGLASGIYDIRVKSMHSLANLVQGFEVTAPVTSVAYLGTLLEGDVDNDNDVDAGDASLLNAAFGTIPGDLHWDARADLNDNQVINLADYGLLSANFGLSGDQLVEAPQTASLGGETWAADQSATAVALPRNRLHAGAVALSFAPQEQSCEIGDIITVELIMAAGAQQVDTVDLNIAYPSASLRLVDAAGDPVTEVETGTAFDLELANNVDNLNGRLHLAATEPGGSVSGTVTLATLRFEAIGPAPNARLRLLMFNPTSDVWFKGVSVLGSWPAGTVHVQGTAKVLLPIVRK